MNSISRNAAALKRGRSSNAVQVVQQALIDLGVPLSVSDGIFGRNTEGAVKRFQKKYRLKEDGVVGPKTLKKLDDLLSRFQYRVRLHFRSINLTNVPFDKILHSTERVYAQYGIKMEMVSGKSLFLTPAQTKKFSVVNGSCTWNISAGEIHELQGLGGAVPSNEVLVFYVNRFSDVTLLGCGGHAKSRPAVTVASNASQWDTAHEIGHVLLSSAFTPVHDGSTKNLMHATASSYRQVPVLSNKQLAQIRSHACCVAV